MWWLAWAEPQARPTQVEALACTLSAYSPSVSLRPRGVLVEVRSSLRLFGGPRALWSRLQAELLPPQGPAGRSQAPPWRHAGAPCPEAAWLLALAGASGSAVLSRQRLPLWLNPLPLPAVAEVAGCPARMRRWWEGAGLRCLGELRALPRGGLERRLGPEWMGWLDRVYGLAPDPQPLWQPPATFERWAELPERTAQWAQLQPTAMALLQGLEAWLLRHHRGVLQLQWTWVHDRGRHRDRADTCRLQAMSVPERQPQRLWTLCQDQALREPLPHEVVALGLKVLEDAPWPEAPEGLWSAPAAGPGPAQAWDRVQARLGPQRVGRWQAVPDHRPERASRFLPGWAPGHGLNAAAGPAPTPSPPPTPALTLHRPVWLYPQALPLEERDGRLWHGPVPLALRSRPERLEGGWFDELNIQRDYHLAEGQDHRWRWVYRQHGAPEGAAWFMQGWWA